MAKAKGRGKSRARSGKSKAATQSGRRVDIAGIRQAITRLVAHQADDMVKAVIEEAKKGHSAALRYLFEMIGLYPATLETEQTEKREMSLAELFCRELGLPTRAPEPRSDEGAEGETAGERIP